jgi:spermidine synthase
MNLSTPATRSLRRMLQFMFLLSGATALVYQVVWTRILTLFFGSTTLAVSTVLAVFMAGLAIGSAVLGGKADTVAEPVRFYGKLELGIGLLAMATPLTFAAIEWVYVAINGIAAPGFWAGVSLRVLLSCVLLLPPTILMGGSLPVLSKVFLAERGDDTVRSISLLYFVNTFGAVIGAVAAGMFLLQLIGVKVLLMAGGAINIGIFLFTRRMPLLREIVPAARTVDERTAGADAAPRWSRDAVLAVAILFFSGMAALIYEVAWTRVLTLVIGSSVYAFTIMLATFLVGIALGSALIGRYSTRLKPGLGWLAACQLLIGALAVASSAIFGLLPDAFVWLFGAVGEKYGPFLLGNFLLCFSIMVPATLFMGASFPVASALVVESLGSSGRRIGLLYAGNTVGAILGAFLAGFVLLPRLGIQNTLILTVFVNLLSGLAVSLVVLARDRNGRNLPVPALSALLILLLALVWRPSWDRLKMTSGPYAYALQYQEMPIAKRLAGLEQLYYREGPMATVSVVREGEHVRLVVDGKSDAGNYRDMTTQVLLGHLPLLLRPQAQDVLIVGYASGITAGATGRHDVRSIDCVEIESAMEEASRFFATENYGIRSDARFRLVVDDARSYQLTTDRKYDVIISEPSNPWQAGSSRLFTRESFVNTRRNLKAGGLMAQWMHLYGVDTETFRLVARTFLSVFPHASLWADPEFPDVIFLGSTEPIRLDPVATNALFSGDSRIGASLARIGYPDAAALFKAFLLGEDELRSFAGVGAVNTDDLPLLEYRAPRSLYSRTALQDNVSALLASKSPESFPAVTHDRGDAAGAASLLKDWGRLLAERRSIPNARGALLRATETSPQDDEAQYLLALLRMQTGDAAGAIESFERAVALNSARGEAYANLGTLYLQAGDRPRALANLNEALALGSDSSGLRNNRAVLYAMGGRMDDAIREAEQAMKLDPDDPVARDNLARFRKMMESK